MDYRYLAVLSLAACSDSLDLEGVTDATGSDVPTDQSRDDIYVPETILSDSSAASPPPDVFDPPEPEPEDHGERCAAALPTRTWRVVAMSYRPDEPRVFPGFDLDGDGSIDNNFGADAYAVDNLLDVHGALQEGLAGEHVPLVSLAPSARGQMLTGWLAVVDALGLHINASSFYPGSATPRSAIELPDVAGYRTPHRNTFHIEVPLAGTWLDFAVVDARMSGALDDEGTSTVVLGGVVPIAAIRDALNDAGAACDCIAAVPLVDLAGQCHPENDCEQGSTCDDLAILCRTTLGLLAPDIDLDLDGDRDARDGISMGLELELEPTEVVDIEGCPVKEAAW